MKRFGKAAIIVATALAMCLSTAVAYAHDVPDASRAGSISISMTYDKQSVPGGTVTLHRVGDVVQDDGDYGFALTDECAASGVSLDDLESADAAKALASYAQEHRLEGTTRSVDDSGTVVFADLEIGLYLVTQQQAASGYLPIDPFLVSVPMNDEGTYVYDVDASPKLELEKAPEPPVQRFPETGDGMMAVAAVAGGALLCAAGAGLVAWRKRNR